MEQEFAEEMAKERQLWEFEVVGSRLYHEAPDVFDHLIVPKCSKNDACGVGCFNALRLTNLRCMQAVHAVTTKLTLHPIEDDVYVLPIAALKLCQRIDAITCCKNGNGYMTQLPSLHGCPAGLKKLVIVAASIKDLSPLVSCPMLEELDLTCTQIKDISPLSSCLRLKAVEVSWCQQLSDLSPLSACTSLDTLVISNCTFIQKLPPLPGLQFLDCYMAQQLSDLSHLSSHTALKTLVISKCPLIKDLNPLASMPNLRELYCCMELPELSVLPLASCQRLHTLVCHPNELGLRELRKRRPSINVICQGQCPKGAD